jgi:hypothetical protein
MHGARSRTAAADSVGSICLLCEHSKDSRTAYPEGGRNGVRRFAAGMHPTRQPDLGVVQRPGSPTRLSACSTRFACRCAAFAAKLKFKLSQAREYAGHYAARGIRRVDSLAQ